MPWCEPCDAFYNPNSVGADGRCPDCGTELAAGDLATSRRRVGTDQPTSDDADPGGVDGSPLHDDAADDEVTRVPWHFWVAVVAMVIYLGFRLVQLTLKIV